MHAEAQQNEKTTKVVDKERYARAAEAYAVLPGQLPRRAPTPSSCATCAPTSSTSSCGKYEEAGREYLAVGKTQPVGKYHKDALLQAMGAFEKVRKPPSGRAASARSPTSDRLFGEAADLYATLFPKDKEIVTVIYKNGQFFFDYGDYDEAIKRFGLIVERYPDDPNAGAAGDRILRGARQGQGLREHRDLGAAPQEDQGLLVARTSRQRLDKLIVGSMMKSGEKYAGDGKYDKAAAFFMRVPNEYPEDGAGAQGAEQRGARCCEKAKKQDEAVAAYKELADKYPQASEAPDALFTAARIEENIAYYDKAAALYEQLGQPYPQNPHAADALRSAGVLRQSLGQHDRGHQALRRVRASATRTSATPRTSPSRSAVVREDQKDWKQAPRPRSPPSRKTYPGDAAHRRGARARGRRPSQGRQRRRRQGRGRARRWRSTTAAPRASSKGERESAARTRATTPPRRATSRASWSSASTSASRSPASRSSSPRCWRRRPSGSRRRRAIYLDVVTYKSPEWATAALLRIGQGYEAYAKAMRNAPVPKDLNEEEKQIYRDELEKVVVVIEDKALDAYKSGYAKALQIGVYNKHTQAIRQALSRLAENEYPKEAELRLDRAPGRAARRARADRGGAP